MVADLGIYLVPLCIWIFAILTFPLDIIKEGFFPFGGYKNFGSFIRERIMMEFIFTCAQLYSNNRLPGRFINQTQEHAMSSKSFAGTFMFEGPQWAIK